MADKKTWFDAFFKAVTTSPEFKSIAEKDWKWDFSKALKDMEKNVAKAWDLVDAFNEIHRQYKKTKLIFKITYECIAWLQV